MLRLCAMAGLTHAAAQVRIQGRLGDFFQQLLVERRAESSSRVAEVNHMAVERSPAT